MKRTRSGAPAGHGDSADAIDRRLSDLARQSAGHLALELAAMALDASQSATRAHVQRLVQQAERRVAVAVTRPIDPVTAVAEGRMVAQAASQFFLAGASSTSLFDSLCRGISVSLLHSFCAKTSRPNLSDLQFILNHLAICGYLGKDDVIQEVLNYLSMLSLDPSTSPSIKSEITDILSSCQREEYGYWLHMRSGHPLHQLWQHSAKKRKVRDIDVKLTPGTRRVSAAHRDSWKSHVLSGISDGQAPVILDLGCGYGVSLLGMSTSRKQLGLQHCIFMGCDLSAAAIAYANNLSDKWGLSNICRFSVAPVEDFLVWFTDNYKGPIMKILIQFPTPYKLPVGGSGSSVHQEKLSNSQLPSFDHGFMVTQKLIDNALEFLTHGGTLFIQSNVEDVAVKIKRLVEASVSFTDSAFVRLKDEDNYGHEEHVTKDAAVTQRAVRWAEMGGERAEGEGWLSASPFGLTSRTETEAAYMLDNKRIFRIAWRRCR